MNIYPRGHHNPGLMFVLAISVGISVLVTSAVQANETVPRTMPGAISGTTSSTVTGTMPGASQARSANTSLVQRIIDQLISLNPGKKIHNWVPGQAFSQRPVLSFTPSLPAQIETQSDELAGYVSLEYRW